MKFIYGLILGLVIVSGILVAHGFFRPHKIQSLDPNGTAAVVAGISAPVLKPDSSAAPKAEDQEQLKYKFGDYSRLYDERQHAFLATPSLDPEAARRANGWKRAGDWDEGFQRTKDTLNLDPSARLVPALQPPPFQPPFQLPPVQMPAIP